MRHADAAVVVTNPEVSSVRDSDRIIGMLDSKTAKAERGERIDKHLLLTRYDPARAARGEMLKTEDVLEILSIPLLGIIPESEEVLRASNLGTPVTLGNPNSVAGEGLLRGGAAAARRDAGGHRAGRTAQPHGTAVRPEGRCMNLLSLFRRRDSAPVARERLQVLLAHERAFVGKSDLLAVLQEEIIAVIAKHVTIERDRVQIKLDRGDPISTLEIDVEVPSAAAAAALRAGPAGDGLRLTLVASSATGNSASTSATRTCRSRRG